MSREIFIPTEPFITFIYLEISGITSPSVILTVSRDVIGNYGWREQMYVPGVWADLRWGQTGVENRRRIGYDSEWKIGWHRKFLIRDILTHISVQFGWNVMAKFSNLLILTLIDLRLFLIKKFHLIPKYTNNSCLHHFSLSRSMYRC